MSFCKERVDFFKNADGKSWLVRKDIKNYDLTEATGNYDRNGFIIYKYNHKINCYVDSLLSTKNGRLKI